MNNGHEGSVGAGEVVALVQVIVGNGEEDEAEKRVESRSQQGQEVTHARNDLGEHKGDDPDAGHDGDPGTPADNRVAVRVTRLAHNAEVDELCADVGVDDSDDHGRDNDEGEGSLSVRLGAETAKGRGRGVLAEVVEADRRRADEQEGGDGGQHGQGLGEVLGPFHLRDESWEQDLGHPKECNIEDCIKAVDPGRAGEREGVRADRTVGRVVSAVAIARSVLDAGEDQEE